MRNASTSGRGVIEREQRGSEDSQKKRAKGMSTTRVRAKSGRSSGKNDEPLKKEAPSGGVEGLDLGDRTSSFCILAVGSGEVVERGTIATTATALQARFSKGPSLRIAMEVGTHSPWVSRLLSSLGHEVLVANTSRMSLGGRRRKKTDRTDAEALARIARADPKLLYAIRHRGPEVQASLALLKSRDKLVRVRASLISHARGQVKSLGGRLSMTSTDAFTKKTRLEVPEALRPGLEPIYRSVENLTLEIRTYERRIEQIAKEHFPEVALLTPIVGVGTLTGLAFALTLESPDRYRKSRSVGAYTGLAPGVHQSGDIDPELGITKAGSPFLRKLLCEAAQYMLGPFGKDCDLRRHGLRIAGGGGKIAKRRAVVAVARKLAVLMHRLWSRGEVYDPLYNARKTDPSLATALAA